MKLAVAVLLLLGVVSATQMFSDEHYENEFAVFVQKYEKTYAAQEFFRRFRVFKENMDHVVRMSLDDSVTHEVAMNHFGDLTNEEYQNIFLGYQRPNRERNYEDLSGIELADSLDWVAKGAVTGVKDQGQCGSCWAFSGTSTVESAVAIKTGELYDLSEQESVDCSTLKNGYTNMGCNGGMYDTMWKYVKANGGICSEDSYPYTSGTTKKTGTCQKTCTPIEETKVSNYVTVKTGSDDALMTALNVEPVSIAIEADTKSFQLYKSGVYTDYEGCGTTLDHAVVLVGYGSCSDGDYYILRNSWGTGWGENGYMRIGRGSQYETSGMCGLLQDPMYPVV